MTVQEFFDLLAANSVAVLTFFFCLPFSALLSNYLSGASAASAPWKYLYSGLIYLVSIPGLFALTLLFYLFLFERVNVMELDIVLHILPIVSMIATILIIQKKVSLDLIPGFDKITGFLTVITVVLIVLWVLDRTRLWVVTFLPLPFALLIFAVLLVLFLWGWRRISGGNR
jgi:hypothetical protein